MRPTWLLTLVVLVAVPAHAVADRAATAERHFRRAKAFHKRGEYTDALRELKGAYEAVPTPSLLYGIAQTYVKLGNCADAITYYQKFIDTKPPQDAIDRAHAGIDACKTEPAAAPVMTAKEHFARATELHKQGDFANALVELTAAYQLEPSPTLMYAIAQTHVKLANCAEAITFYQRFIDSKPKAEAAERARAAIDKCKASTATTAANAKPAIATVDTKVAEPKPSEPKTSETKPAATKLTATKPVETHPIATTPDQAKRIVLQPAQLVPREQLEVIRLDREDRYDRHPTRSWAFAGAGLGAAAMLAATAFGAAGDAAQKSFDDAGCGERNQVLGPAALAKCVDYERRGARDVRIGNALLLGGGSVLALFTVVLILDPGNIERPRIAHPRLGRYSIGVSPSSVSLSVPW